MTKTEAKNRGLGLILFDEQIKTHPKQDVLFDYSIRIITTRSFRDNLVSQNSASDRLTLEQKIMGRIVSNRYPSSSAPIQRQPLPSSTQPQPSTSAALSQQVSAPVSASGPSKGESQPRPPSPSYSPRSPSAEPLVEESLSVNPAAAYGMTNIKPNAHYLMPAPKPTTSCSVPHLLMPPPPASTTGACPGLSPTTPFSQVDMSEVNAPAHASTETVVQEELESDSEEEAEEEENEEDEGDGAQGAFTITVTSV